MRIPALRHRASEGSARPDAGSRLARRSSGGGPSPGCSCSILDFVVTPKPEPSLSDLVHRLAEVEANVRDLLMQEPAAGASTAGPGVAGLKGIREALGSVREDLDRVLAARTAEGRAESGRVSDEPRDLELARLRLQFERMPLGCVLLDPDLTVTDWNPSAERIFGWPREEALGRSLVEMVVPEGVRPWLSDFVRDLSSGSESRVAVNENLTRDGRRIVCEWHDTPLRDGDGNVVGFLAMIRDVSDRLAVEEELRGSRARFGRLLERIPVATAVVREDDSIEFFNKRAVDLFGPEATAADTFAGFLGTVLPEPEERRTTERALSRLRENVESGVPEPPLLVATRLRDGPEKVVAVDCVVVDDLVVWTASDLTEVLRLEAERARLGRIVEESIDEVYVFDAGTLGLRNANRSARDNVGRTLEELRGLTLFDIAPELSPESLSRRLGPLRERHLRGLRFETVHRRKDGSTYPVEVHLQLSAEGGDPVLVAIVQDISLRRRAEVEIRALNAELESRVRARTAELEHAIRELEAFSYSVSHDLRAPLRAMDGFSQILLDDYGPALDDEGRRQLGRVRAGAQRMGRLVDDLLRLSRIARAELCREDVSLSALAEEIGAELHSAEPSRSVELTVEPGLTVRADRNLLRILLENLLRNAFKFSSRKDRARVWVGREAEGGGAVYFVRDDGAGFDMRHASGLFKAFSRLHAPGEFEGTGIGLAIVERIVRRHGGRVWAESAPGEGATFRFDLGAGREGTP